MADKRLPASKATAAMLRSRDYDSNRVLGYFQRLNVSGLDFQGQVSSAYAQSGLGLSAGLSFDFGALVMPFLHANVGLSLSGSRSAHAVVVLQRTLSGIWDDKAPEDRLAPWPPPDWTSKRPLALGILNGRTSTFAGQAAYDTWFGIGTGIDETSFGAAAGVEAQAGISGSWTCLKDVAPRHYRSDPKRSSITGDVDDLFETQLKLEAKAWIANVVRGASAAREEGFELESEGEREARKGAWLKLIGKEIYETGVQLAETHDMFITPDVNWASASSGVSLIRELGKESFDVGAGFWNRKQNSRELIVQLESIKARKKKRRQLLDRILQRIDDELAARGTELPDSEKPRHRAIRNMRSVTDQRVEEARALIKALQRRIDAKKSAKHKPQKAQATGSAPHDPVMRLNITMTEGNVSLKAGAKLVASGGYLGVHGYSRHSARRKRISFRFESFAPGRHEFAASSTADAHVVRTTQDTALNYDAWVMINSLGGVAGGKKSKPDKTSAALNELSYRSVHVAWVAPESTTPIRSERHVSGLSLGVSIPATHLGAYVDACLKLAKVKDALPTEVKKINLHEVEQLLRLKLAATRSELRQAMRTAPDGIAASFGDDALLVESAFVFNDHENLAVTSGKRIANLLEHAAIEPFSSTSADTDLAAIAMRKRVRLQSIRLRFRIRRDDDLGGNLLSVGWNPKIGDTDVAFGSPVDQIVTDVSKFKSLSALLKKSVCWLSMPFQSSFGFERVKRVGAEGIFDVHIHHFGSPEARNKQPVGSRHSHEHAETMIPAVTLFSQ